FRMPPRQPGSDRPRSLPLSSPASHPNGTPNPFSYGGNDSSSNSRDDPGRAGAGTFARYSIHGHTSSPLHAARIFTRERRRQPMRMVQVGVLGMGKWWVQVGLSSPDVEVAGYVDINPGHLKVIQEEFGIAPSRCYVDFDRALKELKPDAVLIVTPPEFHEPLAVKAMEAGCHVLTEKPLADTWEACLRTVEAVRRTGRIMMVAQNYRYRPPVQTLRNALASGQFGAPGQVLVHFTRGPRVGGFCEEMPYPLIIDMAIHHYDLMRYILDADPVRLTAFSWNPPWSWYRGDASSVSRIEMIPRSKPASGQVHPIHVTYHAS